MKIHSVLAPGIFRVGILKSTDESIETAGVPLKKGLIVLYESILPDKTLRVEFFVRMKSWLK